MSPRMRKILSAAFVLWFAIVNCNVSVSGKPAPELPPEIAATATSLALTVQAGNQPQGAPVVATSTFTPLPQAPACSPYVSANNNVNVRSGPGTVYDVVGNIPQGGTAPLSGKSADGTWWFIEFAGGQGGHAWVSGSVTTAFCVPATLVIVAAPPTPTPLPTSTPTPTSGFFIPPVLLLTPLIILPPAAVLSDIELVDIFLTTHKEVVVRVAVNPSGTLNGQVKYKLWVDGSLIGTYTETLPNGSIAYYTGYIVSGSHSVKVTVDSNNAYNEPNEANNTMTVTCNSGSLSCN